MNVNSLLAVPIPPVAIVPVAPPDAVILSPAANSDPDPASVVGPMDTIVLPDPCATAKIVAVAVLPPDPVTNVSPTAKLPLTLSTVTARTARFFTTISVNAVSYTHLTLPTKA